MTTDLDAALRQCHQWGRQEITAQIVHLPGEPSHRYGVWESGNLRIVDADRMPRRVDLSNLNDFCFMVSSTNNSAVVLWTSGAEAIPSDGNRDRLTLQLPLTDAVTSLSSLDYMTPANLLTTLRLHDLMDQLSKTGFVEALKNLRFSKSSEHGTEIDGPGATTLRKVVREKVFDHAGNHLPEELTIAVRFMAEGAIIVDLRFVVNVKVEEGKIQLQVEPDSLAEAERYALGILKERLAHRLEIPVVIGKIA